MSHWHDHSFREVNFTSCLPGCLAELFYWPQWRFSAPQVCPPLCRMHGLLGGSFASTTI
jgi:hypothetical protein